MDEDLEVNPENFQLTLPAPCYYNNETDYTSAASESEIEIEENKTPLRLAPPPESVKYEYVSSTETFLDLDLLKKHCIAFGSRIPDPVDNITQIPGYDKTYLKKLVDKQLNIPTPIQSYLWPLFYRERSGTCVSAAKTGKTLAYLIPILRENQFKADLTCESNKLIYGDEGPRFVVVCSGRSKVADVRDQAYRLLDGSNYPRVISVTKDNEKTIQNTLLNGCELLISTPGPLKRLIEDNIVSFDICNYLIFDDADKSFVLQQEAIQMIVLAYFKTNRKNIPEGEDISNVLAAPILVLAESWSKEVKHFTEEYMKHSVQIFGDVFEAAIAQNIEYSIHSLLAETKRLHQLIDLIHGMLTRGSIKRIAVVCSKDEDCSKVKQALEDLDVIPILIDSNVYNYDLPKLVETCSSHPRAVTVIADGKIKEVSQINFIETLVHYNLPANIADDAVFRSRFLLMSKLIKEKHSGLSTHFILSSSNSCQAHFLCQSLRRIKDVPKDLESLKNFSRRPLCENFMAFGFCPFKSNTCLNRHQFKIPKPGQKCADPVYLPRDGQIRFELTFVVSANQFYMRLLDYRDSNNEDGTWVKFKDQIKSFYDELQTYKDAKRSQITKLDEKSDYVYGLEVLGTVSRVRVIKNFGTLDVRESIAYQDKETIPYNLEVFFIDYGHTSKTHSDELIQLPEHIRNYPPLAYKAYLLGVKPTDNEIEWTHKATDALFSFLRDHCNLTGVAWIRFQKKNIFWLDFLKIYQNLDYIGKNVACWTAEYDLIEAGFAEKNDKLLPRVNENMDELRLKWSSKRMLNLSSKAFLPEDGFEVVQLSHFINLNEFYVQRKNSFTCLNELEKELAKTNHIQTKLEFEGMIGIAKIVMSESQINYSRIMVKKVNLESNSVEVFCLDWGETYKLPRNCCYYIDEKFVKQLPFQAIKCSLISVEGEVDPDTLYDLTRDEDETYKEVLAQKVNGHWSTEYSVRLWFESNSDSTQKQYNLLSKWLVDNGYANYTDPVEINEESVKIMKLACYNPDDDEDDDELAAKEARCRGYLLQLIDEKMVDYLGEHCQTEKIQFDPSKLTRKQKLMLSIKRLKGQETINFTDDCFAEFNDDNQNEPDISQALPYDPSTTEESDLDNLDELDIDYF